MHSSSLSVVKAHRHILLSVKTFACNTEDHLEVFFSLFDSENEKFLRYDNFQITMQSCIKRTTVGPEPK